MVLTDRYIFSLMARAIARDRDPRWIETIAGIALVPHAIYYLRAEVEDLVARVVVGRGAFEYWESGMDVPLGRDRYESFVRYQESRDPSARPDGRALRLYDDRRRQTAGADFPRTAAIDQAHHQPKKAARRFHRPRHCLASRWQKSGC